MIFPDFSLTFPVCSKFPDFSLTGKCLAIFPGFPGFPVRVGTLFMGVKIVHLFVSGEYTSTTLRTFLAPPQPWAYDFPKVDNILNSINYLDKTFEIVNSPNFVNQANINVRTSSEYSNVMKIQNGKYLPPSTMILLPTAKEVVWLRNFSMSAILCQVFVVTSYLSAVFRRNLLYPPMA